MTQSITTENFGAWVLKCNPATWDLATSIDDGGQWIDSWSVQDNYRSARMRVGDPVAFWVAGSDGAALTPGIWGVGVVTVPMEIEALPGDGDDLDPGYWLDPEAKLRARHFVKVHLPLLEEPIRTVGLDRAA